MRFNPKLPLGSQIYNSFTDEQLLDILRGAKHRLNRLPIKRDMHNLALHYIKLRFGSWHNAFVRVGLAEEVSALPKGDTEKRLTELSESSRYVLFQLSSAFELP